jgi:hypothetical protein
VQFLKELKKNATGHESDSKQAVTSLINDYKNEACNFFVLTQSQTLKNLLNDSLRTWRKRVGGAIGAVTPNVLFSSLKHVNLSEAAGIPSSTDIDLLFDPQNKNTANHKSERWLHSFPFTRVLAELEQELGVETHSTSTNNNLYELKPSGKNSAVSLPQR